MMKMGELGKWGKVVLAGFVLPVAMLMVGAASYAMAAVDSPSPVRSLEEILNSPDIQLSEKAKVGGRVTVVENLEDYYGEELFTLKGLGATGLTAYYAVKAGCVKAGAKLAGKKIAEIGARVFGKKVTVKVTPKVDPLAKPPTVRPWKGPMIRDLYKASKDFLKISGAVEVLERLGEAVRRKDYEEAQKILMCEVTPKALSEHIPGFPSDILILVCDKAMPMTVDGIREAFEIGFTGIGWTPPEPFVPDFDLLMPDFDLAQQAFPGLFEAAAFTPTQLVNNNEFTTGLEFWETYNNPFVATSFGPIGSDAASLDGSFAVVHTGLGHPNNLGFVQQHLTVPISTQATFNMLYNFVTTEFPNWHYAGVLFDDFFKVTIKGPIGGIGEPGEIVLTKMRAQTDMAFTHVHGLPADVLDMAATEGGQTGWKLYSGPSLPFGQGMYLVRIEVQDVADNIFDSAILIDRVSLR